MGALARIGFFNTEMAPILKNDKRPTYKTFLLTLLGCPTKSLDKSIIGEKEIAEQIAALGFCEKRDTATRTAKTIL